MTKTISIENGVTIELHSVNGTDWFMREQAARAFARRKAKVAYLSARQKEWLSLVELPADGHNVALTYRNTAGGEA